MDDLLQRAGEGGRISPDEALWLYTDALLHALGQAADAVGRRRYPDNIATYIIDRNINYTNVCLTACKFCAFYRSPKHAEGWTHSADEEILRRCARGRRARRDPDHAAGRALAGTGHGVVRGDRSPPSSAITPRSPCTRWARRKWCTSGKTSGLEHAEVISAAARPPASTRSPARAPRSWSPGRAPAIAPLKESGETWLSVMETAHGLGRGVDRDLHDGHRRDQRGADRASAP